MNFNKMFNVVKDTAEKAANRLEKGSGAVYKEVIKPVAKDAYALSKQAANNVLEFQSNANNVLNAFSNPMVVISVIAGAVVILPMLSRR